MPYEAYLYSIPKVSEDGKQSLPASDSKRQEFTSVDDARRFAIEHKDRFDLVVLVGNGDDGQKLVERYVDAKQA